MITLEEVAVWRKRVDAAIAANAKVQPDDPDWQAVSTLEEIADAAVNELERLLLSITLRSQ